jgi:hypothetical protein
MVTHSQHSFLFLHSCPQCNIDFLGSKRDKYCSKECQVKHNNLNFKTNNPHYYRYNRLPINGKNVVVRKREYLDKCELCGIINPNRIYWHHWDDFKPELGIWVCGKCHWLCESVEYSPDYRLMERYKEFKRRLENGETNLLL